MTKQNEALKALRRISQGICELHDDEVDCEESADYQLVLEALQPHDGADICTWCKGIGFQEHYEDGGLESSSPCEHCQPPEPAQGDEHDCSEEGCIDELDCEVIKRLKDPRHNKALTQAQPIQAKFSADKDQTVLSNVARSKSQLVDLDALEKIIKSLEFSPDPILTDERYDFATRIQNCINTTNGYRIIKENNNDT